MQARLENLVDKLRQRGHRLTPQRMAVLKILLNDGEHLNVEQIYERVRADFSMTSLATVYKTIAVLKEMGEVLELSLDDNCKHYDGSKPHPHPHLICVRCKSVKDIDVDSLSQVSQEVAQQTGYRIVSHRLDFFGVCPQCQE
jgi:Fur family peroxide stress response transcriptional regulator